MSLFWQPTSKNRGWLINPLGDNPWWTLLVTALPALLCTILIFMDQQITAVIINRKEHKLKVSPFFSGCCSKFLPPPSPGSGMEFSLVWLCKTESLNHLKDSQKFQ